MKTPRAELRQIGRLWASNLHQQILDAVEGDERKTRFIERDMAKALLQLSGLEPVFKRIK